MLPGNQGQNIYPNPDNYPVSSFPQEVPAPDIEPDDAGTLITVQYSWEWQQVLLAAVDQLLNPATWQGDNTVKGVAIDRAALLKEMLQIPVSASTEIEAPYWEDSDGDDADDQLEPADQDWYGLLEGANFVDTLAGWVFTGAVALTYGVEGAVQFATFLHNLRLLFRTGDAGTIVRVLIDGLEVGTVDTYSPTPGLAQMQVYSPGSTLWIVNTGTANPAATPDADGHYQMAIVRKRLSEAEIYPPNQRYDATTDTIQITPDNGVTWHSIPDLDPRHSNILRFPARTETDKRCNAAANEVKWLRDFIDPIITALESLAEIFQVANVALPFYTLIFGGVPAIIEVLLELASVLTTIGGSAMDAAFDEGVYDALLCIFYCRSSEDGQVSAGQFASILSDINASPDINTTAALALGAILGAQGEVGLSNAGAIGSETADCSGCDCTSWPRQFDLCGTDDSWTVVYGDLQANGVHSVDSMGGWPSVVRVDRAITIPSGSEITEIDFWGLDGTGANNRFIVVWNGSVIVDITNPGAGASPFKTTGHHLTGSATMIIEVVKNVTGSALRLPAIRLFGTGVAPAIGHDEIEPPTCV